MQTIEKLVYIKIRPVGQAVKTPPFHGGNMGSSPVRVTSKKASAQVDAFLLCPNGKDEEAIGSREQSMIAKPCRGVPACGKRQIPVREDEKTIALREAFYKKFRFVFHKKEKTLYNF